MQAEGGNTSAVEQCWAIAYAWWHEYEIVFQLISYVSLYWQTIANGSLDQGH